MGSFRAELGIGVPIGSLTSQHFANFYLGWFDRFVKEQLRLQGYVRYMDDMLFWHDDQAALKGFERIEAAAFHVLDEIDSFPWTVFAASGCDRYATWILKWVGSKSKETTLDATGKIADAQIRLPMVLPGVVGIPASITCS